MAQSRYSPTLAAPVRRAQDFNRALLDQAAMLFLSGDADGARRMLRGLVQASIGFDQLALLTGKPAQGLQRMLAPGGNPSMDNLAAIFAALRGGLNVRYCVRVVDGQRPHRATATQRYATAPANTLTSAP